MDNRTGKGHDATGRSTGKVRHFGGRAKGWKFEEGFVGEPMSLLESPGYRALNFPAHKILAFLKLEHVRHGGAENGRLMAPHRQLQDLGISARHIKPALAMLEAFGIIRCTTGGERQGGRPNAAKYALTWLPTCDGSLPTGCYRRTTEAEVNEYHLALSTDRAAKAAATAAKNAEQALLKEGDPPALGKATETKTDSNACLREGDSALLKEGTIYILGARPAGVGVAGRGAEPSNSAASRPAARSTASAEPLSRLPEKIGPHSRVKRAANDAPPPRQPS